MRRSEILSSLLVIFLLATTLTPQANAARPSARHPVSIADSNAGWTEVGDNSASGGGISDNSGYSYLASIAVAPDGTPYVAWTDGSSGVQQIYVRRWNGSNWEEVGAGSASGGGISNNSGSSVAPDVAIAPNGTPYVAWYDYSGGPTSIYVRRWNGSSWAEVGSGSASGRGISGSSYAADNPTIAIAPNGTPYVAWAWNGPSERTEIHVKRWNGSKWVEVGSGSASSGGISNSYCAWNPSIAVSPDNRPCVVWENESCIEEYSQIYIRRWNGSSWEEVGSGSASGTGISNTDYHSLDSVVEIAPNGTPFVVWKDSGGIYVLQWNGTAWVEAGAGSASSGGIGDGMYPAAAVSANNELYVTYSRNIPSAFTEVYAKQWDGSTWREVGTGSASGNGISATGDYSYYPQVAVAPTGRVYVAWEELADDGEIYVRQGPPSLERVPSTIVFLAEAGGADPRPQAISATSSHSVITWTITISPTASWLSASPISGTTPSVITATAIVSGLSIDDYTTQIVIDGGQYIANNPQAVTVTLIVAEEIHKTYLPLVIRD
jgi:hypothetical protein